MKAVINDVEYEGSPEEIAEIVAILGKSENVDLGQMYFSESKGELIPVKDMDDVYIMNALRKRLIKLINESRSTTVREDFLDEIGPLLHDDTVSMLYDELERRELDGD